jgi:hypothetical protein
VLAWSKVGGVLVRPAYGEEGLAADGGRAMLDAGQGDARRGAGDALKDVIGPLPPVCGNHL